MASIRQKKIEGVIQKELSVIFQEQSRTLCLGAMVSVTKVNVAPDMSFAKCYISIFGGSVSNDEVHQNLMKHNGEIRFEMGKRLGKSFRRIPELAFHIDDSLDYAEEIDRLLKE